MTRRDGDCNTSNHIVRRRRLQVSYVFSLKSGHDLKSALCSDDDLIISGSVVGIPAHVRPALLTIIKTDDYGGLLCPHNASRIA